MRTTIWTFILFSVISGAVASTPENVPPDRTVAQSLSFAVYCGENFGVATQLSGGIAGIDLRTRRIVWKALRGKIPDVGPVAVGDVIAVITDTWSTIYAFSKITGKLLWQKRLDGKSNDLVTDGRYFYVNDRDNPGVIAIDIRTGKTAWILRTAGGDQFQIRGRFLYSSRFVVNLRTHKLLYEWPEDIVVYAIAISGSDILLGDNKGNIVLYNANNVAYKMQNRFHVGDTMVAGVAANKNGILVSLRGKNLEHWGTLAFLTWGGKRKWNAPGFPVGFDSHQFALAGESALVIEPIARDKALLIKEKDHFVSRNVATGKVNWTSPLGAYTGPPAVCGNTVFILNGDNIVGFNVSDGTPYGQDQ